MTCHETRRRMKAFIKRELPESEMEEFLNHIKTCPSCEEDLLLNYTVLVGIEDILNEKKNRLDIGMEFHAEMNRRHALLRYLKFYQILIGCLGTMSAFSLLVSFFVLCREIFLR